MKRLLGAARFLAVAALVVLVWSQALAQNAKVTILTINDVYEITPKGGLGGMAELMTLLKKERASNPNTITTINGDFLSPSVMSALTKGAQMIDLFNAIGVDYVSLGNHEFDYGPEVLKARIAESKSVWVNSNVLQRDGKVFPGTVATHIKQVGDVKIGFFALLTPETTTLSSPGEGIYFNPATIAAQVAVEKLKAAGAHVIVAMTHLNFQDDRALARNVKGINVILGGHDHDPITFYEGGVLIHKSGADAAFLGAIDLDIKSRTANNQTTTTVLPQWRMHLVSGVAPDPETAQVVAKWTKLLDEQLGVAIGKTNVELDSRRSSVRAEESTMGNLIADAIRAGVKADVAITNGGGIRGDKTYAAGATLTRKDILGELPFGNTVVLLEMTGQQIWEALENGVSQVEDKTGRFPQVSGLTLVYDPKAERGKRLKSVTAGGKPLDLKKKYKVATNDFMAAGGDGFTVMTKANALIDASGAILMATVVMDYVQGQKEVAPKLEGRIATVK